LGRFVRVSRDQPHQIQRISTNIINLYCAEKNQDMSLQQYLAHFYLLEPCRCALVTASCACEYADIVGKSARDQIVWLRCSETPDAGNQFVTETSLDCLGPIYLRKHCLRGTNLTLSLFLLWGLISGNVQSDQLVRSSASQTLLKIRNLGHAMRIRNIMQRSVIISICNQKIASQMFPEFPQLPALLRHRFFATCDRHFGQQSCPT